MNRLLIIDGHAYAYRAFHAIRELNSPAGHPVNAIYGFVKMLEKMRAAIRPTHLVVVWDGGLSSERMDLLPEYKAQRPEMPGGLRTQIDEIRNYLAAAGIIDYCGEGIEADDYIACLAGCAAKIAWNVVIASADKDFMQLVSAHIGLLNPNDKTGMIWGREQVSAKTGVEPEQIAEWLALMGDAVDNIAGVPGVGPKTAAELLKQFGSIDRLYEQLDKVKSVRLRFALSAAAGVVKRNLKLVRLSEVPCDFPPEKSGMRPADLKKLQDFFRHWGFKGMLAELEAQLTEQQAELI